MNAEQIAKNLRLSKNHPRHFLVSVSGGLDSSVLFHALIQLKRKYSFELSVFHMNFGLRGADSSADEKFVEELAAGHGVPVLIQTAKITGKTAIQEKARKARLKALQWAVQEVRETAKDIEPELVEAHHADDQVETFLFRLFRGSGLKGLSGIQAEKRREGICVWRPLLGFSKDVLRKYAQKNRIAFREDSSNRLDIYDRNWIRLNILPAIEKRFPKARESILRLIQQIQEEERVFSCRETDLIENFLVSKAPLIGDFAKLQPLPIAMRHRIIHSFFLNMFKISLSRKHVTDLSEKIGTGKSFSHNAPGGVIVRGRMKSRTVATPRLLFYQNGDKPIHLSGF